jgi:plastocyanin
MGGSMRLGGFTLLVILMVGASCGSTETPAPASASTPGIPSASPSTSSAPAAAPEFTKTCTGDKAIDLSGDDPFHVAVHNFRFVPSCYIVSLASSSVVTNKDDVAHTFTIDATLVNAPLAPHHTYRHGPSTGFLEPGAYQFHCSIHPRMKGTVIEVA